MRDLESSNESMARVFDAAPLGMAVVSAEGVCLQANQRLADLFGCERDALVGASVADLTHPDDLESDLEQSRRLLAGEFPRYRIDKRYLGADGTYFRARVKIGLLRTDEGAHCFLAVVDALDDRVVLQQELQVARRRLARHFEHSPLAVIEFDEEFRVLSWSPRASEIFGWSEGQAVGRGIDALGLIPGAERSRLAPMLAALVSGETESVVAENVNRTRDGALIHCEWYSSSLHVGDGGYHILSFVHDVTERIRQRDLLTEQRLDLERSNADLERFAYVASHDLQEPLRMVSSYTQLLASKYRDRLDDQGVQFIDYAVDGARRMGALIRNLLDYSRSAPTEFDVRVVSLDAALSLALRELEGRIRETGAEIRTEPLPDVLGIQLLVERVLVNLLGNALKFVEPGTTPRVVVRGDVAPDGRVRVCVVDNGIGIAPDHALRIFEPFERLHPRSRFEGSGIGLSICRRALERMGGYIEVNPAPGGGSEFCIGLPGASSSVDGET